MTILTMKNMIISYLLMTLTYVSLQPTSSLEMMRMDNALFNTFVPKKEKEVFIKRFTDNEQQFTATAMHEIAAGLLGNFDPLVGDTACHLRALFIALFYDALHNGLMLDTSLIRFATLTHILAAARRMNYSPDGFVITEGLDRKGLPAPFTQAHLNFLQQLVADYTVRFMQQLAVMQEDSLGILEKELTLALSQPKIDTNGRSVLACFPAFYLMLRTLAQHSIPVIIRLRVSHTTHEEAQNCFTIPLLCTDPYTLQFSVMSLDEQEYYANRSAVVISGQSTIFFNDAVKQEIFDNNIELYFSEHITDILLANAAMHEQYPTSCHYQDEDFGQFNLLAQVYANSRAYGIKNGCDESVLTSNNALFVIKHIHADLFKNVLSIKYP